ncbi:hypothetical protein [Bizionia paragorgiae]|uniref:hypothetical protein n=1 Tax=Bizionia paragorgiae TaxID=283786 RepID=UPI003A925EC4
MNIKYGKQLEVEELIGEKIDLFLLASNHEDRVLTAYEKINKKNKILKTVSLSYERNCIELEKEGIESVIIEGHQQVSGLLDKELGGSCLDEFVMVVDYSCMTKSWYYTVILYLKKKRTDFNSIKVYFVYTPSKYNEPKPPKSNTEIAPLPGKYIVPTDKPKALIVCLGYEQSKAEGIIEHLDPKEYYIFYSEPALDQRFTKKIKENNLALLNRSENVISFPINDLRFLERELTSLYYLLKDEYSIIIAPLGPKPFTLVSMLMAIRYRDIDIWRVGSGSDINEYKREPIDNDSFIIMEVFFK